MKQHKSVLLVADSPKLHVHDMEVTLSVQQEDDVSSPRFSVSGLVDTGCDHYVASVQVLNRMGYTVDELIPATDDFIVVGADEEGEPRKAACLGYLQMRIATPRTTIFDRVFIVDDPLINFLIPRKFSDLSVWIDRFIAKEQQPHGVLRHLQGDTVDSKAHEQSLDDARAALLADACKEFSDAPSMVQALMALSKFGPEGCNTAEVHVQYDELMPTEARIQPQFPESRDTARYREDERKSLQSMGVIEPVPREDMPNGKPPFMSPQFVVWRNGKGRVVTDLKRKKAYITLPPAEFPSMRSLQKFVSGKTVYTVIDAKKWFYQLGLAEESRNLSIFQTESGYYRYKRLVMGLSVSPAEAQRIMREIFTTAGISLDDVYYYIDDVLLASSSIEEHEKLVRAALRALDRYRVCINLDKLQVAQTHVQFCGYILGPGHVVPDPEKVAAIQNYEFPDSLKKLQRFIGLLQYVRQAFRINLSDAAAPLTQLLGSEGPKQRVQWKQLHDDKLVVAAFEAVKAGIIQGACNWAPTPEDRLVIVTDASDRGMGAALLAMRPDGSQRVVEVASKTFTRPQRADAIREAVTAGKVTADMAALNRELEAILFGLERFNFYTRGRMQKVKVLSDHKPLQDIVERPNGILMHTKVVQPVLRRQLSRLYQFAYDIEVEYIEGSKNIFADFLSRDVPSVTVPARFYENLADLEELDVQSDADAPTFAEQLGKLYAAFIPNSSGKLRASERELLDRLGSEGKVERVGDVYLVTVRNAKRIFVPQREIRNILTWAHGALHQGVAHMQKELRSYWWRSKETDIKGFKHYCGCWQVDAGKAGRRPVQHQTATRPRERFQADLAYLDANWWLVAIDVFSRYPEIVQLTAKDSEGVYKAMHTLLLSRYQSDSLEITTDGESILNGIRQLSPKIMRVASIGNHGSQGMIERLIRSVREVMGRTGADPVYAVTLLRTDPMRAVHNAQHEVQEEPLEPSADAAVTKEADRKAVPVPIERKVPEFNPGDMVIVYDPKRHKAGTPSWRGPRCVVSLRDSKASYNVRDARGTVRPTSPNHMRRFHPPSGLRPRAPSALLEHWADKGYRVEHQFDPVYESLPSVVHTMVASTQPGDFVVLCHPVWPAAAWYILLHEEFEAVETGGYEPAPTVIPSISYATLFGLYTRRASPVRKVKHQSTKQNLDDFDPRVTFSDKVTLWDGHS